MSKLNFKTWPILFLVFLVVTPESYSQSVAREEKLKRADCFFGVHFDLHASEDIKDAGKTLTFAMVDTFLLRVKPDFIQIDCKGHPGISSYPTKAGYHVAGFEKDPLRLFRDVTAKNNVALFMHFSGVWDGKVVKEHPDWAIIKSNGERSSQKVSFFSPYLDTYMIPQLKELAGEYKVDGAWIDGECWAVEPDYGEASVKGFTSRTGIAEIPRIKTDQYWPEWMEYTRSLFREHLTKYIDAIHKSNPDFQITSNWAYSSMMPEKVSIDVDYLSGDVTPQNGVYRSAFEARCLAPQGKPWDLMAWGFSWNGGEMPMSIKSAVQLKQEAAEIIAMGGGVQFYFQQNRDLSIKPWIAEMLGDIGQFCRERQVYTHKAVPVPQIALLYPSEGYQKSSPVPYSRSLSMLQGTLYSLLDGQNCVEILMEHHLAGNMKKYPLIIIPECNYINKKFIEELSQYVNQGGNLIVIGSETAELFREELGISAYSKSGRNQIFFEAKGRIGSARSDVAEISLKPEVKVLSRFYRGSDFNAPSDKVSASINNYGKGRAAGIYFNAGSCYSDYKTHTLRDFLSGIISELMPEPIVGVEGSHLVHVTLNRLNGKTYINLINTAGEHTNQTAIGYDEIPSLQNISVSVKTDTKPFEIILQPEGKKMNFKFEDGKVKVSIEEIKLHSILEIRYAEAMSTPKIPAMMFGDNSRTGTPFSKDPHVIRFGERYLMYYSIRPYADTSNPVKGLGIGIAESNDLINWKKTAEIIPSSDYESKGLCAPCALVIDGKVHLFYQTYGNGKNDAICHAWSSDGINFTRNATNPIFHPEAPWTCGRAIDAEVIKFRDSYLLYYATRDPEYKIQMQGVAVAPANTDFKRQDWKNLSTDKPMLKPELPWEKDCIEGASVIEKNGKLYMFYAGAYNNAPQQIGVAVSSDGISWTRFSEEPFLKNGDPGSWNSSESGHPHIFADRDGRTWLFFQGNNDKGKTWYLSNTEVKWNNSGPYLAR